MPTTRTRLAFNDQANLSITTARISLTSLPVEILAEILLYTCSPPAVLAVSRTCSFLYRSLVQNADASFIWRGVRRTCKPVPLPDPGDGWKKSEADYAAFVFAGGVCEICRKNTREMYISFAARIRLCGSWHCRRRFLDDTLISSCLEEQDLQYLWVPPLEGIGCLYPSRRDHLFWPQNELWFRKHDWEVFQRKLQAYKGAEQVQSEGKGNQQTGHVLEWHHAAIQRLPRIMAISQRLVRWKWTYDIEFKKIKKRNEIWTKDLAVHEGCNVKDLVATQTYGSLRRRKNLLLETIEWNDVAPLRFAVESELLVIQARHQRQNAEATYRKNLTELKKVYERMRCGTVGFGQEGSSSSSDPLAFPPLSMFWTLRSVRALKGSPDPSVLPLGSSSVTSDISSSSATSLITADIRTWLIPIQKHLMTLLGYPNGWQSASTRTLHPLKRVTARFFCRRCGEGKVGRGYQRELCLDFKGVCAHVCVGAPGKNIDKQGQNAAQENEMENSASRENRQGRGDSEKKSGSKILNWKVDVFEKDEKAISLVKRILELTGLSEESLTVDTALKELCDIRCMTCKGWIVMDFDTAIGHAHRHESMQIQLLSTSAPSYVGLSKKGVCAPDENTTYLVSRLRLVFERGNTEVLLRPSYSAKHLRDKVNYGCKHCFLVLEGNVVVGIEKLGKKGVRAMGFNALRSHAKEKHGIQDIRDEDFFCHTSI